MKQQGQRCDRGNIAACQQMKLAELILLFDLMDFVA